MANEIHFEASYSAWEVAIIKCTLEVEIRWDILPSSILKCNRSTIDIDSEELSPASSTAQQNGGRRKGKSKLSSSAAKNLREMLF